MNTTARASSSDAARYSQPPRGVLATRAAVTIGVIAFAALVVHLSQIVLPLVILSGALFLLKRPDFSAWQERMWTLVSTQLQQRLKFSSVSAPSPTSGIDATGDRTSAFKTDNKLHTSPKASDTIDEKKVSVPVQATPAARRRSKLQVPKSQTPSLRVTDLGVDADGSPLRLEVPKEFLGNFVVEPNSEEPYEFENDFVRGKLLFLLNRQDAKVPERVENIFDGKRRLFWVQVQLQFKKAPSGILYIGGEVPRAMNLGFFTGGLTKIILSVLQSLVRGLHYGFGVFFPGAAATKADEELPHICFPLYTAVDQFVCTPPGSEPPTLGSLDFGEPKEASLARRKSGKAFYEYNTTDTYSFHFHSFFIDFSRWKLQNVPGMRDVDLSVFWSDMPLQLVAYSIKPSQGGNSVVASESDAKKASHSLRAKEYKFCFELSHRIQEQLLSAADLTEDELNEAENGIVPSDEAAQLDELQKELARYEFSIPAWFEYFSSSQMHNERRVGYALLVREYEDGDELKSLLKCEYMVLHTALFAYAPLSFIEHELGNSSPRKRGRSASGTGGIFSSQKSKTLEESISVRSRRNKYSKIEDERCFLEHHLKQLARHGDAENADLTSVRADQLFAAQSALLDLLQHQRTSLHGEWPFLSATFCRTNSFGSSSNILTSSLPPHSGGVVVTSPNVLKDAPHAAVQVVRVVSATRWRHEWITLDRANRVLRFFRMMSSSPSFSIQLDQVLSIEAASDDETQGNHGSGNSAEPISEVFWMHVGLLEKCHHIAFGTSGERERWIESITETILMAKDTSVVGSNPMDALLGEPIIQSSERLSLDSFASDGSPKSRGSSRFVLNDRCEFVVHASTHRPSSASSSSRQSEPNGIVATCLKRVLALQSQRLQAYSTRDLVTFLNETSALKWLNLDALKDDEAARKVFFLNLFHLMQIHASILGFLPKSKLHWGKFFNGVSYNVGGLFFSLAEIEHCVIRAPMSTLRLPIAFLVIPKFHEPDERLGFQLTKKDFRLNFALNCMTKSCWSAVVVYDVAHLDAQLDHIVRKTVDLALTYDRESRVVYLPKACDWYRADFVAASEESHSNGATGAGAGQESPGGQSMNLAMLRLLVRYVRESKLKLLEYVLEHHDALIAKYKFTKYDYRFQEALKESTSW